ncbi:c-type cytochrome [Algicella marina]|uniref:C-type cytochrome n=1 Tax=Algicella marina TaxID=2683284 RepID=A0A6P1T1U3_9RHOB|nr:cytochrome c [Algicella marina]QHQ35623.1 c-type cytochrome [Algicella marina]
MKRLLIILLTLALLGAGVFWVLTNPVVIADDDLPVHEPDLANGKMVFDMGGCTSCHAAPDATGEDKLVLAGGLALNTPFGKFLVPNISSDPDTGIGAWTDAEFVTAMQQGVRPDGAHYYPAFPYTSYTRMRVEDVLDLKAYLATLPASTTVSQPHELGFPFNIRRGLGLWKILYLSDAPVMEVSDETAIVLGQRLVEGPGHCAECHTPRNAIGGADTGRWLAGGPNPDGPGRIPNITPHPEALGGWSEDDIVYYLESGFTPDFDSAGGSMADVVENTGKIPAEWREAIAAYLKSVPEVAPE